MFVNFILTVKLITVKLHLSKTRMILNSQIIVDICFLLLLIITLLFYFLFQLALTKGGTLLLWGSHPRDTTSKEMKASQFDPVSVDTLNIEEPIDQVYIT